MRTVAVLFACIFSSVGPSYADEAFAKKLEALGFLDFCPPGARAQFRSELVSQGWDAIFGESGRMFVADAEELAEGGVSEFVNELRPFLSAQGVKVPSLQDQFGDEYFVLVDGARVKIWEKSEGRSEREQKKPGLVWGLSTVRTFELLNSWLKASGSKQRAFAVNGGNDLFVMFLTEDLDAAIANDPAASATDTPYTPVESYPWFGQRH
jgi:hypothetical protein